MHKIVEKYITRSIKPNLKNELTEAEKTPIVLTIIELSDPFHYLTSTNENEVEQVKAIAEAALRRAKTINLENQDPAVLLIFLELWLINLLQYKYNLDAEAIYSLVKSLDVTNVPIEIEIIPSKCEYLYCAFTGKLNETETQIKKIMQKVKGVEVPYKSYLTLYIKRLAISGATEEVLSLIEKNKINLEGEAMLTAKSALTLSQGKLEEAIKINKTLIDAPTEFNKIKRSTFFKSFNCVIELYKYLDNQTTMDQLTEVFSTSNEGWEPIELEMLKGNLEKALEHSILSLNSAKYFTLEFSFSWYTHLRCHLNNKLIVQTEALLQQKRKNNWRETDYFFWARLERLKGNNEKAKTYFKIAYAYCVKNDRLRFLDYEFKLCLEMTYKDIMQWYEFARSTSVQLPNAEIESDFEIRYSIARIVGESQSIKILKEKIIQISSFDVPVLITGETGTGKELVARCIHDYGANRTAPFIPINCASITETLLQSELFGYEKGAFTGASNKKMGIFESAKNGTVFLDEIGDAPLNVQLALLRVLESNEFYPIGSTKAIPLKCRILAATNATLSEKTELGVFRKDLLFRLERLKINIPALRERKEDIIPIAKYYLELNRINKKIEISKSLQAILEAHDWPGNVRELNHLIERVNLFHPDKTYITENEIDQEFIKKSTNTKKPLQAIINQSITPQENNGLNLLINEGNTTLRRLDRLKNHFVQLKKMTRQEAAQLLKVSTNTAAKYLSTLEDEKFIKRIQPSTSARTHYFEIIA